MHATSTRPCELQTRLDELGLSFNDPIIKKASAKLARGWVLVVDDRSGVRRVCVYPSDLTAAVLVAGESF